MRTHFQGKPRRLTKKAYGDSLGVSGTWLSEVMHEHSIVVRYGPRGAQETQEVVEELEKDSSGGPTISFQFLKKFEKSVR